MCWEKLNAVKYVLSAHRDTKWYYHSVAIEHQTVTESQFVRVTPVIYRSRTSTLILINLAVCPACW